jgi:DNA-binding XRE family transcriptional regulator
MTLKELRVNAGMSALELALLVGVTRQSIYSWEAGKSRPEPAKAKRVADHFGLKVTDLWPIEPRVAA